jgi:hypothetical protein
VTAHEEQSARTPPSTFLFLPIQLSNSVSSRRRLAPPKKPNRLRPDLTTEIVEFKKLSKTGWLFDRPRRRRRRWRVYRTGFSGCQTLFEKTSSTLPTWLCACGKPRSTVLCELRVFAPLAPLFPENSTCSCVDAGRTGVNFAPKNARQAAVNWVRWGATKKFGRHDSTIASPGRFAARLG